MTKESKYAIITGGANGIGKSITEAFLRESVNVIIIDIDTKSGEALQTLYSKLRFFHGDISNKETLEEFIETIEQPIDFLINNAALSYKGLLSNCTYEDFEYVQRIGVTAPYFLVSLLLKKNLLAKGSSIVNIASTRAFQSQPDTESYSAAKGGIIALTHAMAISLSGYTRVNSISPGWIDNAIDASPTISEQPITAIENTQIGHSQHPVNRIGLPVDIAEMVLFLCSNKASFITGENITIDGGMSKQMVYHNDWGWKFTPCPTLQGRIKGGC